MKKVLVSTFLLIGCAIFAAGQERNYVNRDFGFAMNEPKGWILADDKLISENLKKADLSEATIEKFLRENESAFLLFVYTKHVPNAKIGINPKIEARVVSTKLNRALTFAEFKPAMVTAFRSLKSNHQEYDYIVEPTATKVSGIEAVYQISKFSFKTKDETEYKVRSRTYAIPYKTYFFQISFVDELGGEDCSAEFDQLVKSIKIGK